ncbi:Arc family DNA-binding protein [Paenibacillus kobensis]|uniref:Arc family DNA-binding protein n=1 Tax=Paenibacillus kobensis TaxID=59841 RepID=UPI000FDC9286|nr:Arc family DNA-binding protein [Paenibacillus kobensis]
MAKEKKAFPLRLDPELYRALERWAGDEFRSVNSHIEFILREALSRSGRLKQPKPPEDQPDD